ncbi:MAG: hypothetical protein CMJ46_12450 [Planctomyces sp.]|nr:hypothetical protein [Planctomyces sp.]
MIPILISIAIVLSVILISVVLVFVLVGVLEHQHDNSEEGIPEHLTPSGAWPELPVNVAEISFVFDLESGRLTVDDLLARPQLVVDILANEVLSDELVEKGFVILADGTPFFDEPDTILNAESWVAGLAQLTKEKNRCVKVWAHEQSRMRLTRKDEWLDIEDYDVPRSRFAFQQFTAAMLTVCQKLLILIQQYEAALYELATTRLRDAPPDVKARLSEARKDFSPAWTDYVRQLEQYLEGLSPDS